MSGGTEKAFSLLRNLPRVSLGNIKRLPGTYPKKSNLRGRHGKGNAHGRGKSGQGSRVKLPRLGFEGNNTPFYLIVPKEPYYQAHHLRRQYPPLSLLDLQRLIDLGRVDPSDPIDLTTICNTKFLKVDVLQGHYGINLADEGADIFQSQVNIEVQWASELSVAAIERNGGTITTRYFDPTSLFAVIDPLRFFLKAAPIPRCKLPPEDTVEYYSNAKNRGYLADPDKIHEARIELAQKYGYTLPDVGADPKLPMLMQRKDPRQIWYGLEPGWVINLKDKTILKPNDQQLKDYYRS